MAMWSDRVTARCKKKIPDKLEIMVRRVYEVSRIRTSPAGITCYIYMELGLVYEMSSVVFDKHFTVLKKIPAKK